MTNETPTARAALVEALSLSGEILRNIELRELPLSSAALKAMRLARLLNDFEMQEVMEYEVGGYPSDPDGVPPAAYAAAVKAGRESVEKDKKTGDEKRLIYRNSIDDLEGQIKSYGIALAAAKDPNVSVSSANPSQIVWNPAGNKQERTAILANSAESERRLSSRRAFIYAYVLRRHYELKFSGIADDIFTRIREKVDSAMGQKVPDGIKKLTAAYENLQSANPEDWANAVHSCRRLLQELADNVYPARADVEKTIEGKKRTIKLGPDNYINRLIAFAEERSESERFAEIVGSNLGFLGDRLDSIFRATQKGSHATVTREEADRYVVYTYLIVGDLLSLL